MSLPRGRAHPPQERRSDRRGDWLENWEKEWPLPPNEAYSPRTGRPGDGAKHGLAREQEQAVLPRQEGVQTPFSP